MYAQLCKRLSEEAPTFEKDPASNSCTFLRLLIAVCRDKFNNRLKRDITENDVNNQFNKVHRPGAAAAAAAAASGSASTDGDADEEERRHLAKQRMLGNVKFIGELNKLDMLSKNVLHQCIMELLDKKKKRTASAQEMCEDMECLAQLLKTCGKNLDSEQGKELMNQYFDTLERRSKSADYPPRIRFLLKDVIELRENNWVPRKVGGTTEPVPIKQIRTDDDQIIRTPFAQRGRDMRNNDRDGDNWMNRFHLNLQPSSGGFSDMFGSLSVTGASPMMSPFASNSSGRAYNNDRRDRGGGGQGNYNSNRYNKHQQNGGGGGGGPGGGGGMRDDMRSHQNRDRDSRDSQYGSGGGGGGGGRGGDMGSGHNSMSKELAPRFKRNLMTPNQDSVENLQMRPGANSLLFKAASQNQKIPQTLPISTPPSGGGLFGSASHQQQKQKDQQLNSQYPLLSTPTSHLSGGSGGGGSSAGPAGRSATPSGEYDSGNNNAGGKQHQTSAADSGFKASSGNANELNSLNNRKASASSDSNSVSGDKRLAAGSAGGKANGASGGQGLNVTKHGSLEKVKPAAPTPGGKQDKKKDKAFNKEEVLKKTSAYIKEKFYYTEQEEEEEELAAQRAAETVEVPAAKPTVEEAVAPEAAPEASAEEKPAAEEQSAAPAEVAAVAAETTEPAAEPAEKAEAPVAAAPAEVAYDKSISRLLNKVVDGFVELKVPEKCMKDVCLNMLMDIVEKADEKFIERSVLFLQAVLKRISVKPNVIVEVFKQVVNKMNEREALNPRIATHVASLLCRAVHQVGLIKLTDVAAYTDNGQHYPLFLLVLQQLHKAVGKAVLEEMFTASKIDLMNNLPEVDRNKARLGEILDDRNLAFLYPLLKVQAEMQKQLSADPSPSAFYKWIKANVEPKYYKNAGFITSLMTVLLRHITSDSSLAEGCDIKKHPEKPIIEKEQNLLLKYAQLLQTFLANNTEMQLIAIYALQVFCYEENFPKGMLCRWFKYLYEAEVIEEESFILWKEEISDKYPGKGSALFQVNNWLTWLQEAESEDDED